MRATLLVLCLLFPAIAGAVDAGGAMPDVSAPQLADPAKSFAFTGLRGNVVYVDFWASWCVPCRQSMPALDALYRKYQGQGFRVVGVNKDTAKADAERFLQRVPVSFPLVADGNDAVARAFDVQAMPSGYLVDRKGVVRHVHRGFTASTAATLNSEIEALLKDAS
jgi:thiol-disulfide isomerase/thioredoxin